MEFLLVFVGGGLGAVSRYALGKWITEAVETVFPLGTFAANMLGCLVIGFLFVFLEKIAAPGEYRLLLITGFLGGFTTFSSFSLETINLFKNAQTGYALLAATGSILAGLLAVVAGMALASLIVLRT
jgi:CrcB protein